MKVGQLSENVGQKIAYQNAEQLYGVPIEQKTGCRKTLYRIRSGDRWPVFDE